MLTNEQIEQLISDSEEAIGLLRIVNSEEWGKQLTNNQIKLLHTINDISQICYDLGDGIAQAYDEIRELKGYKRI